jgi:hypothetical protein
LAGRSAGKLCVKSVFSLCYAGPALRCCCVLATFS